VIGSCPRLSGKVPELSGQSKVIKDQLVVIASARLPVGREPVAPPGVRELTQLSTLMVAPGLRLPSHRSMCSSDRKRFIVLDVKMMSSHKHYQRIVGRMMLCLYSGERLIGDTVQSRLSLRCPFEPQMRSPAA
jgi:hypothetical protein